MTTSNKRLLIGWLVLAGLTLGYLWIDRTADHGGSPVPSTVVTVAAILIALVKVRIIFGSSWRSAAHRRCCAASPTPGW